MAPSYCKFNFPMIPHVCQLIGCLVGQPVDMSWLTKKAFLSEHLFQIEKGTGSCNNFGQARINLIPLLVGFLDLFVRPLKNLACFASVTPRDTCFLFIYLSQVSFDLISPSVWGFFASITLQDTCFLFNYLSQVSFDLISPSVWGFLDLYSLLCPSVYPAVWTYPSG